MRYKLWLALGVIALLAAVPALAQSEFTGNLFVTVKDDSGQAITGATVKLNGPDFTRTGFPDISRASGVSGTPASMTAWT